jgi:hypothetical protein
MNADTKEKIGCFCIVTGFVSLFAFVIIAPLYKNGIIGRTPQPGQYWIAQYQNDNPFIAHETNTVLAVKNGYVSFKNARGEWNNTVAAFRCENKLVGNVSPPRPTVEDP